MKGGVAGYLRGLVERLRSSAETRDFFRRVECDPASRAVVRCGMDFHAVEGAVVRLGKRVMLNSDSRNYPHYMHSKVKIRMLRPGATLTVGEKTRIHGSCLTCYDKIEIGKRCLIAANTQIMDAGGHRISEEDVSRRIENIGFDTKPVLIGDDVWIGLNCIILPGSRIGRGSVIAAGSVVSGEIPEMVIAGGVPAKVIRTFHQA